MKDEGPRPGARSSNLSYHSWAAKLGATYRSDYLCKSNRVQCGLQDPNIPYGDPDKGRLRGLQILNPKLKGLLKSKP